MMMSKALGPPVGPISALDSDSDPLCTNVLSAPSLFAKMALSPSGAFVVVAQCSRECASKLRVWTKRQSCYKQWRRSEFTRPIYLFISLRGKSGGTDVEGK